MTQVFLVTPTGSNQTYTSDATWTNGNNTIEVIGAGGAGGVTWGASGTAASAGGAGGDYAKISNFSFATPGTTTATYQIGSGHAGNTLTAGGTTAGTAGGDTWFNDVAFPTTGTAVGGRGGGGGGASVGTPPLTGGAVGNGNTSFAPGGTINLGGAGGGVTGTTTAFRNAGGGGGAGGSHGNGTAGSSGASTANHQEPGGSADAGSGGSGGAAGGTSGGNGIEWDATHGSGGGGGSIIASGTSGSGGNYGGGGGAASTNASAATLTSGAGIQGIIVLTWGLTNPFSQTDWPTAPRPILLQTWIWPGGQILLVGKDKLPVLQRDFPNPYPVQWYREWNRPGNTFIGGGIKPLNQQDWPVPAAPRYWDNFYDESLVLYTPAPVQITFPFKQTDWPNPTSVVWYRDWAQQAIKAVVVVQAPFFQTDWPNPQGVTWYREWSKAGNNFLLNKPFSQQDWPLPQRREWYREWFLNLLESTLKPTVVVLPFKQTDWPIPSRVNIQGKEWSINLLETTLSGQVVVVIQPHFKPQHVSMGRMGNLGGVS